MFGQYFSHLLRSCQMPARVVFHRGVETSGNLQRELNESETFIDLLSVVYQVVVKI